MEIVLKQLTHDHFVHAQTIKRDGIPERWVDTAASLMEVTDYGAENHLIGFSQADSGSRMKPLYSTKMYWKDQ